MQHPPIFSSEDGLSHEPDELVLVGPPGCGKTTAVLEHFLLPAVERFQASAVLGCSFTRAAAQEMRGRLKARTGALSDGALKLVCTTIHAEAFRLDRAVGWKSLWKGESEEAEGEEDEPRVPGWEALSEERRELRAEAERLWSVARHLRPEDLLMRPESYSARAVEGLLWRAAGRGGSRKSPFSMEQLVSEVLRYEADKAADGAMDFVDMLSFALRLPYRERELLVVDEAQDLSPLQIALVRRWALGARRLVWVGDPDQGIYSFSGADGTYLTGLMEDERIRTRRLAQSWRVPRTAHAMARGLILRNRLRVDAPYEPADRDGQVEECSSAPEALREVIGGTGSVLVLSRAAKGLDSYGQWLIEQGEPFARERGGGSPLRQKVLIGVVTALHDLLDGLAITPRAALGLADALKGRPKGRWFEGTKAAALAALKELSEREEWLSRRDIERAGVKVEGLLAPGSLEGALAVLEMGEQAEPLLRIVRKHGIGALTEEPRLVLTTMHSAKGREADTVLLECWAPVPSRMCAEGGDRAALEDERKVLYVGLTRTRQRLVLCRGKPQEDLLCLL